MQNRHKRRRLDSPPGRVFGKNGRTAVLNVVIRLVIKVARRYSAIRNSQKNVIEGLTNNYSLTKSRSKRARFLASLITTKANERRAALVANRTSGYPLNARCKLQPSSRALLAEGEKTTTIQSDSELD